RRSTSEDSAVFRDCQCGDIKFRRVVKQRALSVGGHPKQLAVMTGTKKHISRVVHRGGPHIGLLRVKEFIQLWRHRQHTSVADGNSSSITLKKFGPAVDFPNQRLSRLNGS